jgi:hypothetical protein
LLHEFGPRALEPLPRHAAMLNGEEAQQQRVDQHRRPQRRFGRQGVHGPHKPNGTKKDRQEKQVTKNAVKQREDAFHAASQI